MLASLKILTEPKRVWIVKTCDEPGGNIIVARPEPRMLPAILPRRGVPTTGIKSVNLPAHSGTENTYRLCRVPIPVTILEMLAFHLNHGTASGTRLIIVRDAENMPIPVTTHSERPDMRPSGATGSRCWRLRWRWSSRSRRCPRLRGRRRWRRRRCWRPSPWWWCWETRRRWRPRRRWRRRQGCRTRRTRTRTGIAPTAPGWPVAATPRPATGLRGPTFADDRVGATGFGTAATHSGIVLSQAMDRKRSKRKESKTRRNVPFQTINHRLGKETRMWAATVSRS